jgi:hypothetical protein
MRKLKSDDDLDPRYQLFGCQVVDPEVGPSAAFTEYRRTSVKWTAFLHISRMKESAAVAEPARHRYKMRACKEPQQQNGRAT